MFLRVLSPSLALSLSRLAMAFLYYYFLVAGLIAGCFAGPPCTTARPLAICLQILNPFSANAYFWNLVTGLTEPQNALCGENPEFWDGVEGSSSPDSWFATCCANIVSGIALDCDGPETPLPPIGTFDIIPTGWEKVFACAVDVPSRVLANVVTSTDPSHGRPYYCTTYCQSLGYQYAGVEYGTECHCGTGYAGGVLPTPANSSECDMRCIADYEESCGGSWRIQIYSDA